MDYKLISALVGAGYDNATIDKIMAALPQVQQVPQPPQVPQVPQAPQVQQVQVNGKPGLVQLSDEAQGYEIVWLEDYCMVSLGSTIPMTPEKLVELAETVVQQPET